MVENFLQIFPRKFLDFLEMPEPFVPATEFSVQLIVVCLSSQWPYEFFTKDFTRRTILVNCQWSLLGIVLGEWLPSPLAIRLVSGMAK